MKKPIILVGAGIAGLSLAYRLEEGNIPYILIDKGENYSSRIAAGVINPIVFRRMALSWRIDDLLPEALSFYRKLEDDFQQKLIFPIPIRRAFAHQQERDLWLKKQEEKEYFPYLKKIDQEDDESTIIRQKCGTGIVKNAYWIDTKTLLDCWFKKLNREGKLRTETFDYKQVDLKNSHYKDLEFEKIIFCEGYHGIENPWFSYLPLQATKGELLTIKNESLAENELYNYKCFVLPTGNHEFKVGATYTWNDPTVNVTEGAKAELENHFKNLISSPYFLVKHEAGVRPTVLDRRPLLGVHPKYSNLFIYNGLGAKGYLITPLLSSEFISYLFEGKSLDKEVDIQRYNGKFESLTLRGI